MKKINWVAIKENGGKVIKRVFLVAGGILAGVILSKTILNKEALTAAEEEDCNAIDVSVKDIEVEE